MFYLSAGFSYYDLIRSYILEITNSSQQVHGVLDLHRIYDDREASLEASQYIKNKYSKISK